ncbi:amino acid aminotransferase [Kordiimonas pumila]|uniref:Aminotransferase n=1 Tax=Kordiimonas pumila TaxID=2161677 RepID=A0ABV7D7C7_9PROT|nr:amino acid aminotransferase [Kordiimonas pumila]
MFTNLSVAPADPILSLAQLFANDKSADKVDLGIGIYKDHTGKAPVLKAVKKAEQWLLETQATKAYISSAGNPDYNLVTRELLFGANKDLLGRSLTVQTPGGTGALRIAADYIRKLQGKTRIFIPDPTWTNHKAIFTVAGYELVPYSYYDVASGELTFDAMMTSLKGMKEGDVLLLHGCCHNPSGADPDLEQWQQIADLLVKTGALPLVDLAYLGFGNGLNEDAEGLRLLASCVPEMVIASSYSKNFALYRERVGALTLVARDTDNVTLARAHMMPVARTNYSMPPDHGAAIVAKILGTPDLRREWEVELSTMRNRINTMRSRLVTLLAEHGSKRDYSYLENQRGMFALLGISPEAVEKLRSEHHVHIIGSGRVNIAGLTEDNILHVARAIAAIS